MCVLKPKLRLGVNIDHVATLRQQRTEGYPNVEEAAKISLESGADLITVHLREDRRHIQYKDLVVLRKICPVLNLEMAPTLEMIDVAKNIQPDWLCLVPEKRSELTTEGGLDCIKQAKHLAPLIKDIKSLGIKVSLFIEPNNAQIQQAKQLNADAIELHTGTYANATSNLVNIEIDRLKQSIKLAKQCDLPVHAGHGLNVNNITEIIKLDGIEELNIGHSIISRAIFVGLAVAIQEIKQKLY